ncbi:MAG: response regulator [Campylobacterales bacterium]|nr:response regulator [Campylobacterales bacterium]
MNCTTVLLVEDNGLTLEALSGFLMSRCKHLYIAKNAEEAYEIFQKILPDMLITDIRLPGSDGLWLAQSAKNVKRDTVIFVMSAYINDEYSTRMNEIGIDKFFEKPIDLDIFEKSFLDKCNTPIF